MMLELDGLSVKVRLVFTLIQVTAPTKTVKVNGRLGIMQASSSLAQGQ